MMICSYFSAFSTLLNIITLHGTILTILHRGENMALIKCPECGNVVSDKALSCPKCGFPVANFQNKSTVPNTAPPLPNKATSTYDSTDNIYLDCGKGHYIKIENGILSISVPLKPLTQDIDVYKRQILIRFYLKVIYGNTKKNGDYCGLRKNSKLKKTTISI